MVGGGPAGLEAARVCAERGHNVVLFEAANRLGGQVLLAARERAGARISSASSTGGKPSSTRLGVEVRLNAYAEAADVLAEAPEVVIIATGGVPDIDWIEGGDALHERVGRDRRCGGARIRADRL